MTDDPPDTICVTGLSTILGEHPVLGGPTAWPTHRTPGLDRLELSIRYRDKEYRAFVTATREAASSGAGHAPRSQDGWAVRVDYDLQGGGGRYTADHLPSIETALVTAMTAPIHIHSRVFPNLEAGS